MKYFDKSPRTTHTLSKTPSPKNIPKTHDRKPNAQRPIDLSGGGRCASCSGGRKR